MSALAGAKTSRIKVAGPQGARHGLAPGARHALRCGLLLVACLIACGGGSGTPPTRGPGEVPVHTFRVVRVHPHDPQAFTQGLALDEGLLYEGTGLVGSSRVVKRRVETGEVLLSRDLQPPHFGEGVTVFGERLIQLTWTSGTGFVYDKRTFQPLGEFHYAGEGWGLTHDGVRLIMSDGSPVLTFLDSRDFRPIGRVTVQDRGTPVGLLNELEHVKGEVWANVWRTDRIARIDPASGRVLAWIDLAGLAPGPPDDPDAVLNGIAYDAGADRLLVTGKLWPTLFEIEVVPRE